MGPALVGLLGASRPGLGVLSLGGTLLLAARWAAARGRSSAADRHEVWAIGVAGALILPLAAWAIPVLPPTSPLLVVAFTGVVLNSGIRPSSYAAALWQLARTLSSEPRISGVCMADLPWTEVRLRRILDPHTPRRAQHRASRIRLAVDLGAVHPAPR